MIISINFESDIPIYQQLKDQIIIGIAKGLLKKGEPLPSVRRMAADIGINMHTANKAYSMLKDDQYIVMDRRTGACVSNELPDMAKSPDRAGIRRSIADKILPIAAGAACRGMSPEEFGNLCIEIMLSFEKEGKS